jgi:digalactosyldiacylglycerol synthase
MSPWGDGDHSSSTGSSVAPAERALSFISKSLSEVQKGAKQDLELMSQRAKSFRDLANTLDKEWEKGVESFKLPLSNVKNSQSNILKKIRESGSLTGPSFSAMAPLSTTQGDDRDFLKNLTPNLPSFRRVHSDPNFQKRLTDEKNTTSSGTFGWDLVAKKNPQRSVNPPWSDWGNPRPFHGGKGGQGDWLGVKEKKLRKKNSVKLEDWEPLRRAKESVKESFKELESTAATSKTPSEFFENVKKTEFFENVKKNLVRSPSRCGWALVLTTLCLPSIIFDR